jgi:hypothetical protein
MTDFPPHIQLDSYSLVLYFNGFVLEAEILTGILITDKLQVGTQMIR